MVGVDRVKALKGSCRPYLFGGYQYCPLHLLGVQYTHIDYRVTTTGEKKITIIRKIKTQHTLLVCMHRENQFIGVQRPGLSNELEHMHKNEIQARESSKIPRIQRTND